MKQIDQMCERMYQRRSAFLKTLGLLMIMFVPEIVLAASTDTEFKAVYDFINDAATGYLGRAIAIIGGVIGLGMGAATGKALPAAMGVVLAMFGALGPTIVDAVFGSAALI